MGLLICRAGWRSMDLVWAWLEWFGCAPRVSHLLPGTSEWACLGTCFSRCWQRYKKAISVMQVVLPLGHLTFVNIPLAKAHHIAKNVKHQRNIVYLFSGKNCKVTWQRVCIQEEVKKNRAINSIYHRGGAKAIALISGLPHMVCRCILHNSTWWKWW